MKPAARISQDEPADLLRIVHPAAEPGTPTPAPAPIPAPKVPDPTASEPERWVIEPQLGITVGSNDDGAIVISQEPSMYQSGEDVIIVNRLHAVRLARAILIEAGFDGLVLAVGAAGSYVDLRDGDIAEQVQQ